MATAPRRSTLIGPPTPLPTRGILSNAFSSTDELAIRIRELWARGHGHTLELAAAIRDARDKLAHGEWTALFNSSRMPFSKRQADRLIGIARLAWLNETSLSRLPRKWSILHCLSLLDRPVLGNLIQQGIIHPTLSLREAKGLVARFNGRSTRARSERLVARRRVERFCEFVRDGWKDWAPRQIQWTRDELRQLVHLLEGRDGLANSEPEAGGGFK